VLVVMRLSDCIARPAKAGEDPFRLVAHLEAVAAGCGDKSGTVEEKLAFLAGLAHDAAKAAADWQDYITSDGGIRKGPPHAPLGAALFAFWAEKLLPFWEPDRRKREAWHDLTLDWVRMIYRHHGALDDLDHHPPWVDAGAAEEHAPRRLLGTCDKAGLDALVQSHFPEYCGRLDEFGAWSDTKCDRDWHYRQHNARSNLVRQWKKEGTEDSRALRLADLGAKLIFADRRHAAEWEPDVFAREAVEESIRQHAKHCQQETKQARMNGADESLVRAREQLQAEALETYSRHPDQHVFTLLLPTGYGKTLTGLRIGLESLRTGECNRLIYVAPYLSILSHNAKVIERATNVPVFLHHHLSILAMGDDPKKAKEDRQGDDYQPYDLLDTWQAPIIATTFNQLFRALFPARAQECLRIPALEKAFIFIDEPQIVDAKVWCAFLRAMAVVGSSRQCQILLCTATLPPPQDGLGQVRAIPLTGSVGSAVSRYVIHSQEEPWTASRVAETARAKLEDRGSVAVILNTVRDAVDTYQRLAGQENPDWFFLAAMMLPGHKADRIREIEKRLKPKNSSPTRVPEKTGVVCTQVLEAGVDLSFRSLLRARSIFSSVAQAAGRANRHGEGHEAEVLVFSFIRDDGKDSRRFVYKDKVTTTNTDAILASHPSLTESQLAGVLEEYYRRCWEQNPRTTSLQWFAEAALGKWSALAGLDPFGGDYPQVDVLIPGAEFYLREEYRARLLEFKTDTADGLVERSLDPALRYKLGLHDRKLWFQARKRLNALLRQFTVAVPKKLGDRIAEPIPGCDWLWRLSNPNAYSQHTGLAHHLTVEDEPTGGTTII
jgi:CRISPR-associated endonuclease/helicase Cas3